MLRLFSLSDAIAWLSQGILFSENNCPLTNFNSPLLLAPGLEGVLC